MVGSETGSCSPDSPGSETDGAGTGAMLSGRGRLATFFLLTFFATVLGRAFAGVFLRAGADFLPTLFALPDDFAERVFFATFFATVRFAFATGRFFALLFLLFFFAMITFLLAVLRLLALRVAPKKSAVICA